jgi:hypothetical protein
VYDYQFKPTIMRKFLTITLITFFGITGFSQKFLQIETYGKPKAEKLFIGQGITYQLKDSKDWHYVVIEDLIIDQQLIQTVRGYLKLSDIAELREERGWPQVLKTSLYTFGAGWSLFAAVGFATDGRPETSYRKGDAILTASTLASGWLVSKIFKYKNIKLGKRKNLRMIEIPLNDEFPN